jgi:Ca2+-binding EF-hand superfamily protein
LISVNHTKEWPTMKKIVYAGLISSLALGSIAFADSEHAGKSGRKHGGMFAKLDTNSDGKVTREEADAETQRFFTSLDANKDGKVSSTELSAKGGEKLGHMHERMGEKLWSKDANKDGKLTRDELGKFPERWTGRLDTDSDGALTKAELAKGGEVMQAKIAEHAKERFTKLDANKDGSVDTAEFQTEAKARFTQFDANKDGAVEKSELPRHGRGFGKGGKDCHGERGDRVDGAAKKVAPSAKNAAGSAG